jgi:hypothetical protein
MVHNLDGDAYFVHYMDQCRILNETGLSTHADLVEAVRLFETVTSKETLREELGHKVPVTYTKKAQDRMLEDPIFLIASLFLMVEIGVPSNGYHGRPSLVLKDGDARTVIQELFNEPPVRLNERVKFEPIFNARNFERVAGIKVECTSNLADHLRMTETSKGMSVSIFHNAVFLRWHQRLVHSSLTHRVSTKGACSNILPEGLAEETLWHSCSQLRTSRSSAGISERQKLSQCHKSSTRMRQGALPLEKRTIEHFTFWHDRLVTLKQEFDQSRPSTISQWWLNRRNGVQWYTFWVAVLVIFLTVFFGLIQSVLSALQVYKAYHPTPI